MAVAGPYKLSDLMKTVLAFILLGTGIICSFDASAQTAGQTKVVPENRAEVTLSYAPLVKRVASAVTNIYTSKTVTRRRGPALFNDPFFRRFFGDQFGSQFGAPGGGAKRERVQNSLGSGVIVRGDGLVVTNNHVIEGADEITVVINDGREFSAKVIGTDEKTDLAVLKVTAPADGLPFLELADSDHAEVGDLVLAIGNPFGVGQTVTSGIVSALARTKIGDSDLSFFIQTDAAINPGNSGGALVGVDGRLLGVNTAIFSKSGGSHGIGFAIPSNLVRAVVNGVVRDGRLVRPWLGAEGQAVDTEIADSLGRDRPGGVLVTQVYPGAAADKAGLRRGDIILAINGFEVRDESGLGFRIATLDLSARVPLRVWRHGQILALDLGMEPPPERPARNITVLEGRHPLVGAEVANLSPAFNEERGIDTFAKGVMVTRVGRGSVAAQNGVRPGDIIRSVNGGRVNTVQQLLDKTGSIRQQWELSVERQGRELSGVFPG